MISNKIYSMIHQLLRYDRVTSIVEDLHWLQPLEPIDFKLAVLTYQCLHGLAPQYLSCHIQHGTDSSHCRLQSSSSLRLVIHHTHLATIGDGAFPVAGSHLYNSLPDDVTSAMTLVIFQKRLKTYLFCQSYNIDY